MRKLRLFAALLSTFLLLGSVFASSVRARGASLLINEVEVLKLRATLKGSSPEERVQAIAARLVGTKPGPVSVFVGTDKSVQVVVDGFSWLTVAPEDAKSAGVTPKALATAWAGSIQKALALPPLTFTGQAGKLPVGATKTIPIIGSEALQCSVRSSNEKVLKVTRTEGGISIQCVGLGQANATAFTGSATASMSVSVLPYAANLPQTVEAVVTGMPANAETVLSAIMTTVNSDVRLIKGGELSMVTPQVGQLGAGENRSYSVKVRITGPSAFPAEGYVTVVVKNSPIGRRSETELWYCNDPERVKKPGRVFAAALRPGTPARMLYHHVNGTSTPLTMNVEAINPTATPAKLLIIAGDSDPDQNPVIAGVQAADQFVRSWMKYSGEVVTIPPFSVLPISVRKMRKEDTVSGLCYLRLLDGGPEQLVIRTEARRAVPVEAAWKKAMASSTPWRFVGTHPVGDVSLIPLPDTEHIYPNPFKEEEVSYTVGGAYGFVRIGQKPIARQDNQGSLAGNFGVMYTITAKLDNPTDSASDVEVVYEASAGYSGSLFVVNGEVRRSSILQPKGEAQLSRIRMQPHSTQSIKIMTVPLSGSSYPSTITIRPVQVAARNSTAGKS